MILSALLAVLALAGAPGNTRVDCDPLMVAPAALGMTFSDIVTVFPDGRIVMGTLNIVQLGPMACGGLLYASESPSERLATRRLNPGVDFDRLVGVGLQVSLHEANHVALNSADECLVEKTARTEINGLIAKLGDSDRVTEEEAAATASDAALPAIYHGC